MPLGAFAPLPLRLGGSPEEGWPAANHARFCADLCAVKRVQPLASWDYNQSSSSVVTISNYRGQAGTGLTLAPTATGGGSTGYAIFQWADPYFEDDFEQQWPFKIRAVIATSIRSGALGAVSAVWEQYQRGLKIRAVNAGGSATDRVISVQVW
jgi:hypothetical protein